MILYIENEDVNVVKLGLFLKNHQTATLVFSSLDVRDAIKNKLDSLLRYEEFKNLDLTYKIMKPNSVLWGIRPDQMM
ncbi:hypothetical protein IMZ31_22975 (plasmid) [Pontibacillus sp. ALD_SL1]|uniref:hypothetical protein n=1 Tax=Pontibacillus sp. ALD_SL1 TaxID=2777185 RepID=UPI001A96C158|nr:hypothetical protein [Pontibacillus sp. ALD_SL1]QST02317.1 hypothetical protein IMZ31_22975 [Pontibacillus sp. ALD_SL1]